MLSTHYNDSIFGLLDCNNFFVSCERVFQPKLHNRPVVVLSNNDGCVISRSNEAKALQIKMGVPLFKIKDLVAAHNIKVFSSNFTLYGDMSQRVMTSVSELVPALEIYSIDEAFLDLSGFPASDLSSFGKKIVKTIQRWTGIPISLGIASTKTLAKIANRLAKKYPQYQGVVDLAEFNLEKVLATIPIEDIWGIGRGWGQKLNQLGIMNANQLRQQDPELVQKRFNRVLADTVLELQGTPAYELETEIAPRKQIIVSRSFGKIVTEYSELSEALATHITRALEKLRAQDSVAQGISIFLQTCRFSAPHQPYHHHLFCPLAVPSQDTRAFLKLALQGLKSLYRADLKYKKAGIIIVDISAKKPMQLDLFTAATDNQQSDNLMVLLDDINGRIGQGTIRFALEGYQKTWRVRSLRRSPGFTTRWAELPRVKADRLPLQP